jgi:hypothetical protein
MVMILGRDGSGGEEGALRSECLRAWVAVVGIAEVLGTWWKCCGGRSGRCVDRCRESLRVGCVGGAGVLRTLRSFGAFLSAGECFSRAPRIIRLKVEDAV